MPPCLKLLDTALFLLSAPSVQTSSPQGQPKCHWVHPARRNSLLAPPITAQSHYMLRISYIPPTPWSLQAPCSNGRHCVQFLYLPQNTLHLRIQAWDNSLDFTTVANACVLCISPLFLQGTKPTRLGMSMAALQTLAQLPATLLIVLSSGNDSRLPPLFFLRTDLE